MVRVKVTVTVRGSFSLAMGTGLTYVGHESIYPH